MVNMVVFNEPGDSEARVLKVGLCGLPTFGCGSAGIVGADLVAERF
jgi:hypothetical protein